MSTRKRKDIGWRFGDIIDRNEDHARAMVISVNQTQLVIGLWLTEDSYQPGHIASYISPYFWSKVKFDEKFDDD